MEEIEINQVFEIKYIGFWDRVKMRLLDLLITAIPFVLIYKYTLILSVKLGTSYPFLIYWMIFYLFYIFMTAKYGGTPGKLIMKSRIVSKNGNYLNIKGAIYRLGFYIPYSVVSILIAQAGVNSNVKTNEIVHYIGAHESALNSIYGLLSLLIIFDELFLIFNKKKRAVHDLLAGSFVISKDSHLNGIGNKESYEDQLNKKLNSEVADPIKLSRLGKASFILSLVGLIIIIICFFIAILSIGISDLALGLIGFSGFTCCLVSIVLSIVFLVNKGAKKKTLPIVSLIVSGFLVLLGIAFIIIGILVDNNVLKS